MYIYILIVNYAIKIIFNESTNMYIKIISNKSTAIHDESGGISKAT